MFTLVVNSVAAAGGLTFRGIMGDGAWLGLSASATDVAVPLPSSAMMGLALIGGALMFGRFRPRKTRRRSPRR